MALKFVFGCNVSPLLSSRDNEIGLKGILFTKFSSIGIFLYPNFFYVDLNTMDAMWALFFTSETIELLLSKMFCIDFDTIDVTWIHRFTPETYLTYTI